MIAGPRSPPPPPKASKRNDLEAKNSAGATLHSLDFLNPGRKWPPPSEVPRLEVYRKNIDILDGRHVRAFCMLEAFLEAEPTEKKLPVISDTAETSVRSSLGLLLGSPPKIGVNEAEMPREAAACDRIIRASKFNRVISKVAEDLTPCGAGVFKIRVRNSVPYIQAVSPDTWFPVAPRGDPDDITAHVLAWTFEDENSGDGELGLIKPDKYLYAEIYQRNSQGRCTVEHRLLKLKTDGKIEKAVPLDTFKEFAGLDEVAETLVDEFLIVPVFNRPSSRHPYGRPMINEVVRRNLEELDVLLSAQGNTLYQFNKPDISAPDSAFVYDEYRKIWQFRANEAHKILPGDAPITPIVWDIQHEAWEAYVTRLLDQIYEALEISPQLVSSTKEGGEAESGRALRFRLVPTLAKVDRIRTVLSGGDYSDGIPLVLSIASQLEAKLPTPHPEAAPFKPEDVTIEWAESLPKDRDAETERAVKLKQNKLLSTERYLEGEGLSEDDIAVELERLKTEADEERGSLL